MTLSMLSVATHIPLRGECWLWHSKNMSRATAQTHLCTPAYGLGRVKSTRGVSAIPYFVGRDVAAVCGVCGGEEGEGARTNNTAE